MFKSSNRRLRVTASAVCASFAVLLMVNVSVLFADCWRWTSISCCTLSNLNILCTAEGFTWTCKPIILQDDHVGIWFLVTSGGWTVPTLCGSTGKCKYKAPHCGLLPGTCTWDGQTTTSICLDCPAPDTCPNC